MNRSGVSLRTLGTLATALALAVVAYACGSKPTLFNPGDSGDDGQSQSPDTGFQFPDGGGNDAGNCTTCSADLHNVLSCDGTTVLQTCPPDQGCSATGCVPACQSASVNQSTIGCDYYAVNPGSFGEFAGDCYAVYVANTWNSDVTISVDYGGQSLNVGSIAKSPSGTGNSITYNALPGGVLPAGKFAILFLGDATSVTNPINNVPCPVPAGVTNADTSAPGTQMMKPFHITTSAPVVAYDMFPYGGAGSYGSSATLLVPTSGWGNNYLAIHGYDISTAHGGDNAFLQIAAFQDGTQVTISPTSAIVGGSGVPAAPQNGQQTYSLNKGQVVQFLQKGLLQGSPIQSNNPVGVWGGNTCFNIETSEVACDSAHQQLVPVSTLGSAYVAVRHKDRNGTTESPPWRIMGAVDGTVLTYLPSTPAGAPTALNSRQVVKFEAPGPFVVKSQDDQHPFYVSAHMRGGSTAGGHGDPEFVNVVPPKEWLAQYIFMTDPTMSDTALVLVRDKTLGKDVTIDCITTPITGWQTIGTYEYTYVNIAVNGGPGQGTCNNGLHTIKSDAAFGLTVWGWDSYVSYAYPGGASVKPINGVIIPAQPH